MEENPSQSFSVELPYLVYLRTSESLFCVLGSYCLGESVDCVVIALPGILRPLRTSYLEPQLSRAACDIVWRAVCP